MKEPIEALTNKELACFLREWTPDTQGVLHLREGDEKHSLYTLTEINELAARRLEAIQEATTPLVLDEA